MAGICYECKHRGTVPGDAHSCCNHPEVSLAGNPMAKLGIDSPNVGDCIMMLMWKPVILVVFEPINFTSEF